jgi:glycosyltransferase involved in cell wall biosynthesis
MQAKSIVMFVYSDISTDARVQRAAHALSKKYNVTLLSTNCGKKITDTTYNNILIGNKSQNTLLNLVSCFRDALRIIKRQKPDVVYCHDYYSAVLAWTLYLIRYRGKIVYDAHELFVQMDGFPLDSHQSFFYWFEKRIIRKVNLVIGANKERCDIMKSHYNLNVEPIVIRNISQLDIIKTDRSDTILRELNTFFQKPGLTLVYAGAVSKDRKIDQLLTAALKMYDIIKVLIIGTGNQLIELKEISNNNPQLTIAFTGQVPYNCLGALLTKCDIGFLNYPNNIPNNIYCASNKIFEYASIGLPILANENPTVKGILNSNNIGIACDDILKGLNIITSKIAEMKDACRVFTFSNCWDKESNILVDAINQIL